MDFRWPRSQEDIERIQSERKRIAVERAMLSGVRHVLQDPVIAARARGRERFIRACMYVTIALNAYALVRVLGPGFAGFAFIG